MLISLFFSFFLKNHKIGSVKQNKIYKTIENYEFVLFFLIFARYFIKRYLLYKDENFMTSKISKLINSLRFFSNSLKNHKIFDPIVIKFIIVLL